MCEKVTSFDIPHNSCNSYSKHVVLLIDFFKIAFYLEIEHVVAYYVGGKCVIALSTSIQPGFFSFKDTMSQGHKMAI